MGSLTSRLKEYIYTVTKIKETQNKLIIGKEYHHPFD